MDECNIIVNVQDARVQRGVHQEFEYITEGRLTQTDEDEYAIEYEEDRTSSLADTVTRFVVHGRELWLQRSGKFHSEYRLRKNQVFETAYRTPLGVMRMSILPTQIDSERDKNKGRIILEYVIRVGEKSALNKLDIRFVSKRDLTDEVSRQDPMDDVSKRDLAQDVSQQDPTDDVSKHGLADEK